MTEKSGLEAPAYTQGLSLGLVIGLIIAAWTDYALAAHFGAIVLFLAAVVWEEYVRGSQ